jgi:hypothetical protein
MSTHHRNVRSPSTPAMATVPKSSPQRQRPHCRCCAASHVGVRAPIGGGRRCAPSSAPNDSYSSSSDVHGSASQAWRRQRQPPPTQDMPAVDCLTSVMRVQRNTSRVAACGRRGNVRVLLDQSARQPNTDGHRPGHSTRIRLPFAATLRRLAPPTPRPGQGCQTRLAREAGVEVIQRSDVAAAELVSEDRVVIKFAP